MKICMDFVSFLSLQSTQNMHGNISEITYVYAHVPMSGKGSFKAKPGSTRTATPITNNN